MEGEEADEVEVRWVPAEVVEAGPRWAFTIGFDGTVREFVDDVEQKVSDQRAEELRGGFPDWVYDAMDADLP